MQEARYRAISTALEAAIERREYTGRLPSVHKLAGAFQTSPVTLCRALRLLEKRGLLTVIDRKGAFITPRQNRRPRHHVICLVSRYLNPNERNLIYWRLEALAKQGGVRLINLGASTLDILRDEEFLEVINVDGYIFSLGTLDQAIARNLTMRGIPFVTINRIDSQTPMNWVEHDHDGGLTQLYEYLYGLGHRRIAHASLLNVVSYFTEQIARVYRQFMTAHGIYRPEYLWSTDRDMWHYQEHDGPDWERRFVSEQVDRLLRLDPLPTALVFADRLQAELLIQELARRGLRVPEDLSVATYELNFADGRTDHALTVLQTDENLRFRRAFDLLQDLIAAPAAPLTQILIPERVVPGRSTAPPPVVPPVLLRA